MLFRCDNCSKMCIIDDNYKTDWGTQIELKKDKAKCPSCNKWSTYKVMICEDWIQTLIFKIKGN